MSSITKFAGVSAKTVLRGGVVALGALIVAGVNAKADTVSYDASLTSPPGVYVNNANEGFTVDQNGSIELGLGAIDRFFGTVTPEPSSNVYDVATGETTAAGQSGAAWGLFFSINLQAGGESGLTLGDITTLLSVTDVNTGATASGDVLAIPDNLGFGASGVETATSTDWAVQNIEPADILAAFGDPGFDVNADDTYLVSLSVFDGQTLLASDDITVNAAPEPASLAILGAGLAGLGLVRRRKTS